MNPGPIEEAGQTTRSLISSLSSTPMILAVLVFNLVYVAATAWIFVQRVQVEQKSEERWERLVESAFKACPTSGAIK